MASGTATLDAPTAADPREGPSGPIRTPNAWNGEPYNVDWEQINRWDRQIERAAREFGVPFERIKAHIVIESQGDPKAIQKNDANGWSYGLMQVVPVGVGWAGWGADVLRLANVATGDVGQMMLRRPALAVRAGTFVLRSQFDAEGDWDRASSKFFLGNANWNGEDHISGTTGFRYRTTLEGLIREITGAAPGDAVLGDVTVIRARGPRFGRVPFPAFTDRLIPDANNVSWDDLGQRRVKGVVYHRQLGSNWGTDAYFRAMPPGGAATCPGHPPFTYGGCYSLTDFGVDQHSGQILRWNDPTGAAHPGVSPNRSGYASGKVSQPYGDGKAFIDDHGGDLNVVNRDQASIEIAGFYHDPATGTGWDEPITDACMDAVAALSAYFADQFAIPWNQYPTVPGKTYSFVRWHQEFTIGIGKICPGKTVMDATDEIIARTKKILRRHQTGGN